MNTLTPLKLHLQFSGTNYSGWQIQPNALTIQEVVEKVLYELYHEKIKVTACSRTDAGVHAEDFVINFKVSSNRIPVDKIPKALNTYLPEDIVAKKAQIVHNDFHARFDAVKKTYRYTILNTEYKTVFGRNYYFYVKEVLDIEKMQKVAKLFVGKKDFTSFCSEANKKASCVRNVYDLVIKRKEKFIVIDITADGFLYNMVRIITGTLIEAGKGKLSQKDIKEIFKAKNRDKAGSTASAKGLCLLKVCY